MIGRILVGVGAVVAVVGFGAALFFKEEIKKAVKQAQLDVEAELARRAAAEVEKSDDADILDVAEAKCASIYADMKAAYHRL